VYQKWIGQQQTCLAHLIRDAKGLSERTNAEIARCGVWACKELQRLNHMANASPTVGQWYLFSARLVRFISIYGEGQDDAGKFARRVQRELE